MPAETPQQATGGKHGSAVGGKIPLEAYVSPEHEGKPRFTVELSQAQQAGYGSRLVHQMDTPNPGRLGLNQQMGEKCVGIYRQIA